MTGVAVGDLTWIGVNSDDAHVLIRAGQKENLTTLATMSAAGGPLHHRFLACGKIEIAKSSQIGNLTAHGIVHSVSGWMKQDTFERYSELLHYRDSDESELHLPLGYHNAHPTQKMKAQQ
jgi:hypothetical protein